MVDSLKDSIKVEKYSVVMSVYIKAKVEDLIISLDSMLNQSVSPEQIVVVLDGPITAKINDCLKGYSKKYPSVFTIVPLETNRGLAFALNEGISQARNELIARMDGDDYSLPMRCEKQLTAFEKDNTLSLLGTFTRNFEDSIDAASPIINEMPVSNDDIKRAIRRNCPFEHPTVMFRKSAVIACGGYNPEFRRSQDHDLFSRMVCKGYKASNIPEPLLLFRADHNMMLRNKSAESCKARLKIQKRLYKEGNCSLWDYLYILLTMIVSRVLPLPVYQFAYKIVKGR